MEEFFCEPLADHRYAQKINLLVEADLDITIARFFQIFLAGVDYDAIDVHVLAKRELVSRFEGEERIHHLLVRGQIVGVCLLPFDDARRAVWLGDWNGAIACCDDVGFELRGMAQRNEQAAKDQVTMPALTAFVDVDVAE